MDFRDRIIARITKNCMDLREENKNLKHECNMKNDIINRLERVNQDLSERVVKAEGLTNGCELKQVI